MAGRWFLGGGALVAAVLAACAGPYGKVNEIISASVPGDSFRTIVVIAADDDQNSLQITARVRQQLNDAGLSALRRSGIWSIEREALADICPINEPSDVDGLLFVSWNDLTLYDCRSHRPAYQIRGGMRGTDMMVKRLLVYLRITPSGASGAPG